MNLYELPTEILIHIFKYLTTQSKVNVAITCKRLKDVIYSKDLWHNVLVKLKLKHQSVRMKSHNKRFKPEPHKGWPGCWFKSFDERGITQVALVSVNQSRLKSDMELMSKCMPYLNVLIFENHVIQSSSEFIQSIQQHSFINIVSLVLSFNSVVNDAVIQSVVTSMPNLKYLYINGNKQVNDNCMGLLVCLKQLEILDLSSTLVSDNGLALISGYVRESDKFIYDETVPLLTKLHTLNIDECCNVTCDSWQFLKSLPSLRTLITGPDEKASLLDIENLARMKALRCFYTKGCLTNSILKVLSDGGGNKLQMLHLIGSIVNDNGAHYFSTGFSNLCFLSLISNTIITDDGVDTICQFLPQLVLLDLTGCIHITNLSLQCIGKRLFHLVFLCIGSCPKLTSKGLQHIHFNCQIVCDIMENLITIYHRNISKDSKDKKCLITLANYYEFLFKISDDILDKKSSPSIV